MSDPATFADPAYAADALKSLSQALRDQRTPHTAAAAIVRTLRESTGARRAVLCWTRDILQGAARNDIIVDPADADGYDARTTTLLLTLALRAPAVEHWDAHSGSDVATLLESLQVQHCLVVPLEAGSRRSGVLVLFDAPREVAERALWLVEAYAAVLALGSPWRGVLPDAAAGNADSDRIDTDRLRLIERALAASVDDVRDLHDGLRLCLDAAIQVGGLDSGGFYLIDEQSGALDCVVHQGLSAEFVRSIAHYPADSLHAKIVLAGDPMYVEFGRTVRNYPEAERREGLRVLAVIPLRHQGKVIGCLNVASHTVDEVPLARRFALESVAAEAGHAIARLRTEMALRASEARAHALLSAVPDLLFRITREGVFLDYRADVKDLYVQDAARIIGANFRDLLPPPVAAIIDQHLGAAFRTGELQTFEYQLDMPEIGVTEYEARMVASGADEATVVVRNITERNRAQRQLRKNEARFRHLIESANDWIWESDPSGTLSYCSPHCEALTGYTPAELIGRPIFDLIATDDLPRAHAFAQSQQAQPTPFRGFVWAITCKDGREAVLESNGVPVHNDAGVLVGFSGVHRDVTARRHEEEEHKRLQGELAQAQKMESVGRLAGGVAHDFNNMLQAILGNTALVMRSLQKDSPIRDRLTEIHNCAQRSADLTRQLLAFARKQTASPRTVDLNRAVEGMLKMLRRLIGEDIQLAWLPGQDIGHVRIDPSQVDQILANLCVNARDAISGQGLVTISTSAALLDADAVLDIPEATPGHYVRLTISDNGSGMAPNVLARALEPFFTTKELGRGTGLGLSTVYGIVRQNGGVVRLQSELGIGTRIEIYLPVVEADQRALTGDAASTDFAHGNETILLVEDESAILAVAQSMLESLGYRVLTASTPGEALEVASQYPHTIHLLVSDVVMPEMNGLDLSKRLLALNPRLKRLFTSGYSSDVMAQHGLVEAGIRFIQKPFDLDAIARKVRETLDEEGQDVVMS